MSITYPKFDAIRDVIASGCRVADAVQQNLEHVQAVTKDDRSPVTVADFAVQAIVAMGLRALDPDTLIVGEERAAVLRDPAQQVVLDAVVDAVRTVHAEATAEEVLDAIDHCDHDGTATAYWTVDPIDGTKGFLRGQQYAIALGRIDGGVVTFGIMGCPNLPVRHDADLGDGDATGTIYAAQRGAGAWEFDGPGALDHPPRRIEVAAFDGVRPVRVCESVESAHSDQSASARIIELLGSTHQPVRLDSQCKYAVVARGQADAYLRLPTRKGYVEKIWDHAAGSVIAQEAGATVTDISGAPLDFSRGSRLEGNRGILCTAPGLHRDVVSAIDGRSGS